MYLKLTVSLLIEMCAYINIISIFVFMCFLITFLTFLFLFLFLWFYCLCLWVAAEFGVGKKEKNNNF